MKFIRKNGRIIPIGGGGVNHVYKAAGTATAVINGALSAASFKMGWKGIVGSTIAGFGLEAVGENATVKAYSGIKNQKAQQKAIMKQNATNQAIGLGTFGLGAGYLLLKKLTRR